MTRSATAARERQWVLGTVLLGISLLTVIVLFKVVGTIVFGLTVAYILTPAKRQLRQRGFGQLVSTIVVTAGAVIGLFTISAPLLIILFLRADDITQLLLGLPETMVIAALGMQYEIVIADASTVVVGWVRRTAVEISAGIPVLAIKLSLFVFLVFATVYNERDITDNVFSVIPPQYRDVARALHERARDTIYAIYILQGATALATVIIAIPVYYLLGYDGWLALATISGVLQFVPIVGPSLVIVALAIGDIIVGDIVRAVLVLVLGGVLIATLPDVVVRPRIAAYTIELSGTLYFVGFVGGLLTIGPLGIIVGPLLVSLLIESARLLATGFESPGSPNRTDPDDGSTAK